MTPKQQKWKQVSTCITDFTYENNIDWPVTACKWGPIIQETKQYIRQKVYFSTRTDGKYDEQTNTWKQTPSQIIVAHIGQFEQIYVCLDIPQVGYSINHQVTYIFQQLQFYKNPNIKIKQMVVHPGEINVLKCSPSLKLISTKNDNSNVFIWDLTKHKTQQNPKDTHAAIPEIQLIGHTGTGHSTALDWSSECRVGSGGKDNKILIWDISDYQTKLSNNNLIQSKRELNSICKNDNLKLDKRTILSGHKNEVVNLSFNPFNQDQLISCCQDKKLILWDVRMEENQQQVWEQNSNHRDDIHTIQWSKYDENYVATGSNDGQVFLIDIRKPSEQMNIRDGYWVNYLQFGPDRNHITIGSDELYSVNIQTKKTTFCYYGHKGNLMDFDMNERSPWTYLSTSQENDYCGGGSLHIYRLMDLIYLDEDEALNKLN